MFSELDALSLEFDVWELSLVDVFAVSILSVIAFDCGQGPNQSMKR